LLLMLTALAVLGWHRVATPYQLRCTSLNS